MSAIANGSIIIQPVDLNSIEAIGNIEILARQIWTEHYSPIIGIDQVNYMLDKFQSKEAMTSQIQDGYRYYSVFLAHKLVGYFSVQPRGKTLFLSKAYILKEQRGKGIFSSMMTFMEQLAKKMGLNNIELTVNKYNVDSHKIYESKGFKRTEEAIFDIGQGFVMDDFIYQKEI